MPLALMSCDWYQIILLANRGVHTCVDDLLKVVT